MPNTKVLNSLPDAFHFRKSTHTIQLPVHGQGTLLFTTEQEASFTLFNEAKSDGLIVKFAAEEITVKQISTANTYESQGKKSGLSTKSGAYYWFSLDSQNQRIQAGVGEPRVETCCFIYQFEHNKLWEANKIFLESLQTVSLEETMKPLRLLKNPITNAVPMKIKNTDELTMDDVAGTEFLPHATLSSASQILYNCIAGPKFTLNTPDFPDFAKAIEYSIQTPGLWCNTRLKEKATEFEKDPQPLETYLRITLGQNNGESPGIPYVMEIWPVGHYSPIHNHSGANAVIRVLHGTIQVFLYPFLCDEANTVVPFATTSFTKGDITWISSTLNQVHMLKNLETNKDTCITIQCYMYDSSDSVHYDYFDYLGTQNAKNQYEPDSDMDFVEFKKTIRKEWDEKKAKETEVRSAANSLQTIATKKASWLCWN